MPTRKADVPGSYLIELATLQWGRVVADAEGIEQAVARAKALALQWGRVVADAEGTSPGGTSAPPWTRFNGAASLPTRKGIAPTR